MPKGLESFISEHSAEYVLVPNLIAQLAPHFQRIIPIFFWATREGNKTAMRTMADVRVRVLTAFARRPRLGGRPGQVQFKLNEELFGYAAESERRGIPVLAGVPLAVSLTEFVVGVPCLWIRLQEAGHTVGGKVVGADPNSRRVTDRARFIPVLEENDVVHLAASASIYRWEETSALLRMLRREFTLGTRFPFSTGYRPFHLILPESPA